jgi:DNA-directed RNA polymerase subunit RPC12/RpoP
MAHATSSPVAYDCGSCGKPVYVTIDHEWAHNDRHIVCQIVEVLEVALIFPVTKTA